jgi:ATP-dependent RNA helicase SUPV3L1/SUV3
MGLNMDLDHVAFAKLVKFDGYAPRRLAPAEIAQIAGRAGRHMADGTFGTTAEIEGLDGEIVEAVENHRFDPLHRIYWRNAKLDYSAPQALLKSLEVRPPTRGLVSAREADDHQALRALARLPDIAAIAANPARVRLLWEVCQIPDFRKVMSETHARLLAQIYRHLTGPEERLPESWVAGQVSRLDRTDGDIDTLMARIAHIRTWTYVAHRADWLADAAAWQERARAIEDRLSDALHDRLTQRFVDRRSASLVRRLEAPEDLLASVAANGEVQVEGHYVGELKGFRFAPDAEATGEEAKTLIAAANRVLRGEIEGRARRLAAAPDTAFTLDADGTIAWGGGPVARLVAGESPLGPRVEPLPGAFLEGEALQGVRRRLQLFVRDAVAAGLAPLFRAREAELAPPARGLAFQLAEALGAVPTRSVRPLLAALRPVDRKALGRFGIRLGTEFVYAEPLLKPAPIALRALLWSVHRGAPLPAPLPPPGRLSLAPAASAAFYAAVGYAVLGTRALRLDRVERLAATARRLARQGSFAPSPALAALAGVKPGELAGLLPALGYKALIDDAGIRFVAQPPRRGARKPKAKPTQGPFAALVALRAER